MVDLHRRERRMSLRAQWPKFCLRDAGATSAAVEWQKATLSIADGAPQPGLALQKTLAHALKISKILIPLICFTSLHEKAHIQP